MKKVLLIGRKDSGEKNDVRLMGKLLSNTIDKSIKIDTIFFEDVIVIVSDNESQAFINSKPITDYNLVIMIGWSHKRLYSDLAHSLAIICGKYRVIVWNSELITARSMTKLSQLVSLSDQNISIGRTAFAISKDKLLAELKDWKFPIILKDPGASRGRNNFLCTNFNEASKVLSKNPKNSFLAQSVVPNDNSDLRVIVAGGEPIMVIKRTTSNSSHLTNISAGGNADVVSLSGLDTKLISSSKTISRLFKREFCGIDFIRDTITGKYIFLEINLTPQIVNGSFVKDKIKNLALAISKGCN